jgi:hypothetical protein
MLWPVVVRLWSAIDAYWMSELSVRCAVTVTGTLPFVTSALEGL